MKLLKTLLATLAVALAPTLHAQTTVLRIGYQKSASLFVLQKAQGTLEKKLGAQGVGVKWVEFPAGPQLLEGLNVGSVDVGFVGEAPPIFAQAAGAQFLYIGNDPAAPEAEALVVPKDSALKTVADLKGRKVALNKGSNVHYLLVKLLEKNGLKYSDIQPVFLAPADARAAFEKGSVDAWAIWDPFLAAVEKQTGARILADGRGAVNNYAYYLAERGFVDKHPRVIETLFADTQEQGRWLKANVKAAAAIIAPLQGLDSDVVEATLRRGQYGVAPLTTAVAAEQQKIADAFFDLKLIPRALRVADAVPVLATAAR
jgi:sulfonate transport system substrate-binding protein